MNIILIAALNHKRVIGSSGKIPWHIPEDLQRFKQLTLHHTVLMGRKTYESIGSPLTERRNVIISHSENFPKNVEQFSSLDEAIKILSGEEKIFVIGGGEIFQQTIDLAAMLYLTLVENSADGDTFFPPYEHLIGTKFFQESIIHHHGFSFVDYKRIALK